MKFWAIGDSYVDPHEYPIRGKKWASVMIRSLKSDKYFIFGNGGFDAETVLDNLLLNLHLLEDGDLVVLFLPTLWRHRLPLADNMIDKYSQLIDPPKTKNIENVQILNGFMVNNHLHNTHQYLAPPLNKMDLDNLMDKEEKFIERSKNWNKKLDFHKLVTSLKPNALRIESILKSIVKLKPKVNFEFFTWCENEFTDLVKDLQFIKKELGFYETQHMAWLSGKDGMEGDHHFSSDMNERFASYLIKKYPNQFDNNLI